MSRHPNEQLDAEDMDGAAKARQQVGTLLNEVQDLAESLNASIDRRDWVDAADSMIDVREKITELAPLLATNAQGHSARKENDNER